LDPTEGKGEGKAPHSEELTVTAALKRSGVDHTAFTLQTHHTCLSPEGATAVCSNSSHLITAFTTHLSTPEMMKG